MPEPGASPGPLPPNQAVPTARREPPAPPYAPQPARRGGAGKGGDARLLRPGTLRGYSALMRRTLKKLPARLLRVETLLFQIA